MAKLRQVEVSAGQGTPVADAVRSIGVTEATYYRWRQEFGGLKLDQVRRLKELEGRGMCAHYEDVLADIHARDARDSGRQVAPLRPASDAMLLDTSDLNLDQSIAEAIRMTEEQLARAEP